MAIAVRGTPPPRDDADDDRVDDAPRASKTGRREGDGRRDGCGRRGDDEATTTTTTTTRKTRGDVDAVRTVGEVLRGANSNADVKGVVMRATLGLRRRDDASGGWTWTAKDEDGGAEVRLASADVKAHDLGRVVRVRDFVVVTDARNGDAVVVEANCVERADDDDGFEESLACGPLEDEDGVANDARALNGKVGACHRGILEAVSPIITTGESTFFMCALEKRRRRRRADSAHFQRRVSGAMGVHIKAVRRFEGGDAKFTQSRVIQGRRDARITRIFRHG